MRHMLINLGAIALMAANVEWVKTPRETKRLLKQKRKVPKNSTRGCRWTKPPEVNGKRNHSCPCGSGKKFKHCHLKGLCNGKPPVQENANESDTNNQTGCSQHTQATVLEPIKDCGTGG